MTVSPNVGPGGPVVTLEVTLDRPVPNPAGLSVSLSYSTTAPLASPPASVLVQSGRDRARVGLGTIPVSQGYNVTITASSAGRSTATILAVRPPRVTSVRFSRPTMPAPDTTQMTVQFDGATAVPTPLEIEANFPNLLYPSPPNPVCPVQTCGLGTSLALPVQVSAGATEQRFRLYVSGVSIGVRTLIARLGTTSPVTWDLQIRGVQPAAISIASSCPTPLGALPGQPSLNKQPASEWYLIVTAADRVVLGNGTTIALRASHPGVTLPATASYSPSLLAGEASPANPLPRVLAAGYACRPVSFPATSGSASYDLSATSGGRTVTATVTVP